MSSQPGPRQRRLNPFLRKPLWVILEEQRLSSTNGAVATSSNGDGAENGIEMPPTNTDDCDRGLSFDYEEDHDHDGHGSLAERPTHQRRLPNSLHHVHHSLPPRHLTLFDLVSIGVGGTIGSGIFVLNGLIAREYAGPATFLSWIISGVAALLSGCCYAELSGRIPSAGSTYAYAYVAVGELPAFVTAGMLTLEFLLSGSAVAR